MNNLSLQEKLIEDKGFRNQYIGKTEVLNKVKLLSLLPDGESMTARMVAEYYEVEEKTINQIILRNKKELEESGLRLLTDEELKEAKKGFLHSVENVKWIFRLNVIPRKAILNIGMLLRDSEIAKQVRTYLLNVEEIAPKEHRLNAIDKAGSWSSKDELILLDCYYSAIYNGGSLNEGAQRASEKINHTKAACLTRYNTKLKNLISDEKFFEAVQKNRRNKGKMLHLQVVENIKPSHTHGMLSLDSLPTMDGHVSTVNRHDINPNIATTNSQPSDNEKLEQIHNSQTVVIDEMFKQNTKLINEVCSLKDDNSYLKIKVNKMESDISIKEILLLDKDRQIDLLNEKLSELSKENELHKKKCNSYKSKLNNVQAAMTGKTRATKTQTEEQKRKKGVAYQIKDGVPVFENNCP